MKKGGLCAFEVQTLTVDLSEVAGVPSTVHRERRWHIGLVAAGTRDGKVREVQTIEGERYKMDAKHLKVTRVLEIPTDKVNGPALLSATADESWFSLPEVERFVAKYLHQEVMPTVSPCSGR